MAKKNDDQKYLVLGLLLILAFYGIGQGWFIQFGIGPAAIAAPPPSGGGTPPGTTPPPAAPGADTSCDTMCKGIGYIQGYASTDGWCGAGETTYPYYGETCCCMAVSSPPPDEDDYVAPGGDYAGYPSCDAWRAALDKEFFVTGAPISTITECGDYAQSYCSQFGWWVTAYDFATPDCCIWDCSGTWE